MLLFGPAGSGKSSLIKTFFRALNDTDEVPEEILNLLKIKETN